LFLHAPVQIAAVRRMSGTAGVPAHPRSASRGNRMTARSRRLGPTGRTLILGTLGLTACVVLVASLVSNIRVTDSRARELAARALPAEIALHNTWTASANAQEFLMTLVQTQDPVARAAALTGAQAAGQAQSAAWTVYLQHALDRPEEPALQRSYETASARSVKLAANVLAMSPTAPAYATTLAAERRESANLRAVLTTLESKTYDPILRAHASGVVAGIAHTRNREYLVFMVLGPLFCGVGAWLLQSARRDDRRMLADAVAMKAEARYTRLETSLQRALEMEQTEEATYDVIAQAATLVDAEVPAELLLADSSQAHFRQVFSTAPGIDSACRVAAPGDCPATMSGQVQHFACSSDLDTCPYLRGRTDAVWAMCVPLSIAGRATGVLHVQRSVESPPTDSGRGWELIARKAGERIGMLRAFARSETQAHTDPLTGLLNRRSLEARTRDLTDDGLQFVVAYGDLDQFKLLNDVHGHDTGDRALRLFARVLRDSVRPNDIPARYGGEEFVAVLPDCSLDNAVVVIERIRARLAAELTAGTVPPFTVSFGLAPSETGLTFGEIVDAADQALLRAKREGRDRIVIARPEPADDAPSEVAPSEPA
jgi:diguanylate cyclase (GGDEF)-like protein